MELNEAKKLALNLMSDHNLNHWSFKWHNKKRAFGTCYYRKMAIGLSQILIPQMTVEAVTNTILHEIAHALVGGGHGHGYVWRNKAIEIGCDGNRTNNHNVEVEAKYVAICKGCGERITAHRKPKRKHWCKCNGRSFDPEMQLEYIQQY
jgi:predicted SprT family Zn-dependent metalloprotease